MAYFGDFGSPLIILMLTGLICFLEMFFLAMLHYEFAIAGIIVSPWIHWIFATNNPAEFQDFHVTPASYIRVCIVLAIGMVGYCNFLRLWFNSNERLPFRFVLFIVFILYALFSTLYSIDQFYSFSRSAEYVAFFGFLLGFHCWLRNELYVKRALNIFFAIMAVAIIINLSSFLLFPDDIWWWRSEDRFKGVIDHPNTLGALCMVCYPIFMWKYCQASKPQKMCIVSLTIITLFLHILTGSRTSLATAFLGIVVWYYALNHKVKMIIMFLVILCAGFVLVAAKPGSFNRESNKITDLTGRSDFWVGSMVLIKERPFKGYGYEVGGKVWKDPRFYNPYVALWSGNARASLHNGYLTIAIGLGLIGLFLWLILVMTPIYQLRRVTISYDRAVVTVIFFQALLVNFFESEISGSRTQVSIVFWIMWIIAGRLWNMQQAVSFVEHGVERRVWIRPTSS